MAVRMPSSERKKVGNEESYRTFTSTEPLLDKMHQNGT